MKRLLILVSLLCLGFGGRTPQYILTPDEAAHRPYSAPYGKYLPPRVVLGVVDPRITLEAMKQPGFTTKLYRQSATKAMINAVVKRDHFARGGVPFEVDHACSIEIGCGSDPANLWCESYEGPWNAHDKDKLENRLHREVMAGQLTLAQAQRAILLDWVAEYLKRFPCPTGYPH